MTTSVLSIFTAPTHDRVWLDYVRDLKPYDILVLSPDIQEVSDAHAASSESEITLRRWDLDDGRTPGNPDGVYRQLRDDPEGLARWQVDKYGALITEWETLAKQRGIPFPAREQLVIHLTNEPDTNHLLPQINRNTVVAAKLARNIGLKVDGLNLSTGHPVYLRDGKSDWSELLDALEVLEQTGSYAVVHEYFNSRGIQHPDTKPWHIMRHHWAPRGPKYKIGEFGLEEILNGVMADHHGWNGRIPAQQMVSDTDWYLGNVRDDVVGVRFYMTDYEDNRWGTFDSRPIQAQLIEVGRRHPSKPHVTHLPGIGAGPTVPSKPPAGGGAIGYVNAPAGANVRVAPINGSVVIAVPYAAQIRITSVDSKTGWMQVTYAGKSGWMAPQLISMEPPDAPKPTPQPPVQLPSGIIDPLTALAFMQVESSNRAFESGLLVIRFEVHVFKARLKNDALFDKHFKFTPGNYNEQYWRASPDGAWIHAHGSQADRHTLLRFARSLNDTAALRSTGMGLGQVMGDNHARIGYTSPQAMFRAFSNLDFGGTAQIMGFVNYVLSDANLLDALRKRDWFAAVQGYNGIGQEHIYVPALEKALDKIRKAVGI